MSKLQFYGIFVLSVLCGAALSESWKIGISIEDTAIVVNFSIGFFRLPLLSKTWIWSKIQIGITAGCQINCLNNNLLQWTNVLRCFVRDSYLKIYMCLQTNLKAQENKNARAIFKTRNCTLIVHQEGGAADKKCQAFAISPQFAFNSARYGGTWVLPENGWSWCRVRFQVRPIVVSLSLSVSIWISVSVSTLILRALIQDPLYSRLYAEEHEIEGKDFPTSFFCSWCRFLQKAEKWQKMCVSDEAKTFLPEFLDRFHWLPSRVIVIILQPSYNSDFHQELVISQNIGGQLQVIKIGEEGCPAYLLFKMSV